MDNNVIRKGIFMKIKNAITITALSALILAGCSTGKAKGKEDVKSESNVAEEKQIEEVAEELEESKEVEEPEEKFESPYSEIAEHFSGWELPKEGIVPKNHKTYEGMNPEAVAYENGIVFNEETKLYIGKFSEDGNVPMPTEEQLPGFEMGIISGAAWSLALDEDVKLDKYGIDGNLVTLKMEFEELLRHSKQKELVAVSNEIMNSVVEMKKITEGSVSEDELEKLTIQYNELVDKVYQLNKTIRL